jgi:hypothetical protein
VGYYRGDYYRGDYYRGDFFGSLFKGIKGAAVGFLTGGPAGAVRGAATALVGSGSHASLPAPRPNISPEVRNIQAGIVPDVDYPPAISNYPVSNGGGDMIPSFQNTAQLPHRGYHLNKSTYETRGGGTSRWPHSLQLHQKGTVLVRNRRMNVGNARALKRALRRAGGFARLARRVMSFTHPRAGRGRFKVGSRKKR